MKYDFNFIKTIRERKYLELQEQNRQLVGIYYPDNQGDFVIVVSATDHEGLVRLNQLKLILIPGFLICLIIVFFSGRFFANNALGPITKITKRTNEITGSNLHLRLDEPTGNDELTELTHTFNQMLNRIELVFESQKTFVQHASHELRTPITSMLVELDVVLEKERSIEEYRQTLQSVLNEVEKLNSLTTGLLNLAKSSSDDPQFIQDPIYLDELLIDVKQTIEKQVPTSVIVLDLKLWSTANAYLIHGNNPLLKIAFLNLVENASKFSNHKPVQLKLDAQQGSLIVAVIDEGIGISESDASKIFDPFYRSTQAMAYPGFGIGLSLTQKIIHLHKGAIQVKANEGKQGTQFLVTLTV